MKQVALGIDIGGTFTKFGVADREGNILAEGNISTDVYNDVDDYQKHLFIALEKMLQPMSGIELMGIGLGAPNGNFYKGTIEHAANLKWKGVIPFAEKFKKYFPNIPVLLTNDANAAAIGEGIYGDAKGLKDYLVVTLGTGLGSGFVANGELIYGFNGFAGELGHINAIPNGRQCGCGKQGCLETYVSATGIKRTVLNLLCDSLEKSELRHLTSIEITSEKIFSAAQNGDNIALQAFMATGEMLGSKLADAVAIAAPEVIFLFGGLARANDLLLEPTRLSFEKNILQVFKNKVQIKLSGLQDKNIAVLGAAALIWKYLDR